MYHKSLGYFADKYVNAEAEARALRALCNSAESLVNDFSHFAAATLPVYMSAVRTYEHFERLYDAARHESDLCFLDYKDSLKVTNGTYPNSFWAASQAYALARQYKRDTENAWQTLITQGR